MPRRRPPSWNPRLECSARPSPGAGVGDARDTHHGPRPGIRGRRLPHVLVRNGVPGPVDDSDLTPRPGSPHVRGRSDPHPPGGTAPDAGARDGRGGRPVVHVSFLSQGARALPADRMARRMAPLDRAGPHVLHALRCGAPPPAAGRRRDSCTASRCSSSCRTIRRSGHSAPSSPDRSNATPFVLTGAMAKSPEQTKLYFGSGFFF